MGRARRHFAAAIGLLISAGAIWVVVNSFDVGEAVSILSRADPAPLVAIVGIVAVQMVLRAWRWSFLMPKGADGRRLPIRRLLPPQLIGYLGNAVLPARLGEPMRAILASRRERVGTTEALGSVLLERVIDVATLAIVAFGAALLVGAPEWIVRLLGAAALGGVIGMVVLLTVGIRPLLHLADRIGLRSRPTLRAIAERFAATVGGAGRRRAIGISATASVGAWLLDAVSFGLAAQAVGVELSYPAMVLIAGFTVLGTAIPSAPGFVGTFELAAAGAAGALGVEAAPALAMALVAHVMTLGPMALGGAASLIVVGTSLGDAARDARTADGAAASGTPSDDGRRAAAPDAP